MLKEKDFQSKLEKEQSKDQVRQRTSLVNNLSATVVDLASVLTTSPVFSGSADGD